MKDEGGKQKAEGRRQRTQITLIRVLLVSTETQRSQRKHREVCLIVSQLPCAFCILPCAFCLLTLWITSYRA
jgi:hypothetical protein